MKDRENEGVIRLHTSHIHSTASNTSREKNIDLLNQPKFNVLTSQNMRHRL